MVLPMLIRLVGVQYVGGLIRKVAKVGMKKGGMFNQYKAKDLGYGNRVPAIWPQFFGGTLVWSDSILPHYQYQSV
jgi:hypothetical protein